MDTFQTKIIEAAGLKYRIQLRKNEGVWQQRHIWFPAPATFVDEPRAEEWIRSTQIPPDSAYTLTTTPNADVEA